MLVTKKPDDNSFPVPLIHMTDGQEKPSADKQKTHNRWPRSTVSLPHIRKSLETLLLYPDKHYQKHDSDHSLTEEINQALTASPWQTYSLYYRYCMDCLTNNKEDYIKDEIILMRQDLGFSPKAWDPIVIGIHGLRSALPLLREKGYNLQILSKYLASSFTYSNLLQEKTFASKNSFFTPYLLGQVIRSAAENDSRYSTGQDYCQVIVEEIVSLAREKSALDNKGERSKSILIINRDVDLCHIISDAHAVCLELNCANSDDNNYLILVNSIKRGEETKEDIIQILHHLTHEMIHTQQDFAKDEEKRFSREKKDLLNEALTEALVLVRLDMFSPKNSSHSSLVAALLEIIEKTDKANLEEYLVRLNKGKLNEAIDDLSEKSGQSPEVFMNTFVQNFKAIARLKYEKRWPEWNKKIKIIEALRQDTQIGELS